MANIPFLNNAYFSSSVGIGTDSPSTKLHVARSTNGELLRLQDTSNAQQNYVFETESAGLFYGLNIKNGQTGASLLNIGADQRIGIATNNPQATLHVNKAAANTYQVLVGNSNGLGLGHDSAGQQRSIIGSAYGNAASMISFTLGGYTTSSDKMTILGSGNVGIGTINPNSRLHIESSISNGSVFRITTSTSGALQPVFNADIIANGDTVFDLGNYKHATKKIQIKSANTSYIQQVDGSGGFDIKGHLKTSLQTVNGGGVLQLHRYGALSLNDDASYADTPSSALYINTLYNTSTNYLMVLADEGNDKLVVDLNGNVGIGTTSPGAKLHLSGSASGGNASFIIQDNARSGSSALNYILLTDSLNANQAKIGYLSGLNTELTFQNLVGDTSLISSNQLKIISATNTTFSNSGAERMRITSGGNVGIGETNPILGKLQVGGIIHVNRSGSNGTAASPVFENILQSGLNLTNISSVQLGNSFGSDNGTFLRFQVNSKNSASTPISVLTLDSSGNSTFTGLVSGITPVNAANFTTKAYVDAQVGASDTLQEVTNNGNTTTNSIRIGSSSAPAGGVGLHVDTEIRVDGNDGVATKKIRASYFSNSQNLVLESGSSANVILNSSKVGIGTTSPVRKLQLVTINGARNFGIGLNDKDGVEQATIAVDNNTNDLITATTTNIRFFTGSTIGNIATLPTNERMCINSSGNVGIGTTSPTRLLQLTAGEVFMRFNPTTVAGDYRFQAADGKFYVTPEDTGVPTMTYSSGNVGIGTTSPTSKLDVTGTITTSGSVKGGSDFSIFSEFSNRGRIVLTSSTSTGANQIQFLTDGNVKAVINKEGKFGIGTTSPLAKLHVKDGNVLSSALGNTSALIEGFNQSILQIASHSTGYSQIAFGDQDDGFDGGFIYSNASRFLSIETANAERMRIDSAGAIKFNAYGAGTLVSDASGNITVSSGGGAGGPFLPLAGGAMSGALIMGGQQLKFSDSGRLFMGDGNDLQIYHDGTDSFITNNTGDLIIENGADGKDIVFKGDDGSGGLATYFKVDPASEATTFLKRAYFIDNVKAQFGNSSDLQIFHDGSNSYINDIGSGDLILTTNASSVQINKSTGVNLAKFIVDGSVELYFNSSKKFETTSTGVTVTGNVLASGYLVGNTTQYNPTGGGVTLETLASGTNSRLNSVISNQNSGSSASAALVLATYGHDFFVKGTSAAGGSKLTLGFNTNDFLTLTSSSATFPGNVGIGTTSPTEKLEINGNLKISSIGNGNSASSYDLLFYGTTSSGQQTDQAAIHSSPGTANSNSGNLIFETSNSSNALAERMRIDGVGNVGIGTTSPASKLHINNPTGAAAMLIEGAGGYSGGINFRSNPSVSQGYILYDFANTMGFGVANSEKMRILANGNIGIGTTSPTEKLHVVGNIRTNSTQGYYGSFLQAISSTGLKIGNDDFSGYAFFSDNSNIGIGTTSPTQKLHVDGNALVSAEKYYYTAGTGAGFGSDSSGNFKIRQNDADLIFGSGNNIGIGVTSPLAKLHVRSAFAGSFTYDTSADDFIVESNANGGLTIATASANTGRIIFASPNDPTGAELSYNSSGSLMKIGTTGGGGILALQSGNGVEAMRILANGNIGIGTASPTQKLEVDGEVLSDGYRLAAMQTAPAARNSTGTLGEIIIDGDHLYVCYATNAWSRVALETAW